MNDLPAPTARPVQAAQASPTLPPTTAWRRTWTHASDGLDRWLSHDFLALVARVAMAAIFFMSGRTKVEGWLTVTPGAYELFRTEYKLPLLPPELAAHLAAYAEHLFPLLLVLGLATRMSALALLGMTLVIQLLVYPDAWPTHLSWASSLLFLVARGGGRLSFDALFRLR